MHTGSVTPFDASAPTDLPALDLSRTPWPGERHDVDGCELFVRRTPGAPGSEAALFVHGVGGSSTNWTDFAGLVAGRLDGAAVDLPGFGRSDPAARGGYRRGAMARLLARFIEQDGRGPVHLLGNSLGGVVALQLAAARPDLVRTLTLISPAMPDLRPRWGPDVLTALAATPGAARLVARRLERLDPDVRARQTLAVCFADPSLVPENRMREAVEEVSRRAGLPWVTSTFVAAMRGLVGDYLRPRNVSLWSVAARITVPTLVIWGKQDRLVSVRLAERTARAIPGARLLLLDNIGHTAQLEAPVQVAGAVLEHVRGDATAPDR